jgi:hypothetical protein
MIYQEHNLDWFPRMQAISLSEEEGTSESDQLELRDLQEQMRQSQVAIRDLGQRIQELQQFIAESIHF